MNRIKIVNGFNNHAGKGPLLTGILISGHADPGDELVLSESKRLKIIEVEYNRATFPGKTHVILTVLNDNEVIWHTLYGKEFTVEK